MAKREAIAAALFALVCAEAGKVVGLVTSSRKLRHFDSVKTAEMPALFQAQSPETYQRTVADGPPKRTMHFNIWFYVATAQQPALIPSQQINNLVDAVEAALAPSSLTGMFTLGGLVHRCWIEGTIEIYEGVTSDGKSIAIIPIAVLMP
jgi:hypothetical protein